jgi:hypothetical protein
MRACAQGRAHSESVFPVRAKSRRRGGFIITTTIEPALQVLRHMAGGNNRAVSARLCGYWFHLHESRTNARPDPEAKFFYDYLARA